MSTPSSHPLPQPTSGSKKHNNGTPHTTTPRSAPSPAATRKEQSGKTPVNHHTASSSHGSKTLASTPMMHSLSQTGPGLGSSSSPGQGPFGTPGSSVLHGLGVDHMGGGSTPNLVVNGGIPTPVLQQAVNMMPSVSEIMGTGRKRNEDEDRKAKMASIMRKIGKSTGRVTTEGIQRIARRVGLLPSHDESASEISMAGPGEKMIVVVKMEGDFVRSVNPDIFICEFEKKIEDQVMGIAASKVLKQDLTVPNAILLQSSLDKFAMSLGRLARMDRLSKGQVDCFEAINGLHTSLKKLYELEKDAVKALRELKGGDVDERAEREVLRKRSGRPSIHGNGKIGLSLDYWTPNQLPKDNSPMDVDGEHDTEQEADHSPEVWSLRIEAQSCAAGMYPSLRVSDAWLPDTCELTSPENAQGTPWQDPPNTLIGTNSTAASGDGMAIDGGERLPDLRFVAKLDPPILLPFQIAAALLASLGDQYSQNIMFPIYHLHLLGINSQDMGTKVVSERTVLLQDDETENLHEYVLDVPKCDLGYTLEEVPFSHPRQLIDLLPTLRQWASVASLLKDTFQDPKTSHDAGPSRFDGKLAETSLDDILAENGEKTEKEKVRVDVAFVSNSSNANMAVPSFSLAYSSSAGDGDVVFQVLPNGEIVVGDIGGVEDDGKKEMRAARALYVLEDIGLWVEWLRGWKEKSQSRSPRIVRSTCGYAHQDGTRP